MVKVKRVFPLYDFIFGGCAAIRNTEKFLDVWLETRGNPCSVCVEDKAKCPYYKKLEEVALGRRTPVQLGDEPDTDK